MPKNRISKLKDGRYSYSVTDADGKRRTIKSLTGENLTCFRHRCDELDSAAQKKGSFRTLDDLFRLWMEGYVLEHLSVSEQRSTPQIYEMHVQPYLGGKLLTDIKRSDAYNVLLKAHQKGLSTSTIRKIRSCISRPYNWASSALGLELTSPTEGLRFSAKQKIEKARRRVISDSDMKRFMEAAKASKYYPYFRLLQLTGMRPSEALGLQVKDIKDGYITVNRAITAYEHSSLKTDNAQRSIPITPEIREVLKLPVENASSRYPGWLFASALGQPSMDAIMSSFRRICAATAVHELGGRNGMKKLSLKVPPVRLSLYDFRHTFATKLVQGGVNPKALQSVMGHSSINVTLKYYVEMTEAMTDELKGIMQDVI